MIGIDTNILLRFILHDEPDQGARADALMASLSRYEPAFVSTVVLAETLWVLQRTHRKPKSELIVLIRGLMSAEQIVLENQGAVAEATRRFESSNADFADCLIERLCAAAGCTRTVTFDVGASKDAGMVLL